MKFYKLDDVKNEISKIADSDETVLLDLLRLKKLDEDKHYFVTGIILYKTSGEETFLLSRFQKADTAYANLENIYVELAELFEDKPNVKINVDIVDKEESIQRRGNAQFHVINDVLAKVDATARSYCATVGDTYIIGIEHGKDLYPITSAQDAATADFTTEEISKNIEHYFGKDKTDTFDEEEASLLEGFTFVPNKGMAQIFIGKRNRLYLKGDITTLLDITPGRRVLIAYRPRDKAFAIVKPTAKSVTDDMRAAGYFVSKRKDVTCAKLFREFDLDQYEGQTFYADTASLSGNVVIFKR